MLIRIICFTVTLFICCLIGKGQQQYNLVPNYSFEEYNFCPLENNLYYIYNTKPDYWYKPDLRGATYFNSCANVNVGSNGLPEMGMPVNLVGSGYNYQNAKTGNGYVIMFYYNGMNARNYIAVKLKDSLKQGKCYYAEYYINSPNTFRFGCNNQSMLFTNTPVYVDTAAVPAVYMLPANPQIQNPFIVTDTLHWVKIAGVFTAQGGEQYLTLGNFKNNAQTQTQQVQSLAANGAAYYIEDVTVVPLDSFNLQADAGLDKSIIVGDSVFIGSFTTGLTNVTWFNSTGNIIASNVNGLFVKPTASTFYVIEQTVCGQYSRDTVNVIVNTAVPLVIKNYELIIKNDAVVNNWQTLQEVNVSHFNIQFSTNSKDFATVGTIAAQNNAFNEYRYTHNLTPNTQHQTWFYRIEAVDKDGKITYSKVLPFTLNPTPFTLNIFPNPANSIVNIAYKEMQKVTITDIAGRVLFSKQMKGLSNAQLNISSLGKGIFFVRVVSEKGSCETKKLVVQ